MKFWDLDGLLRELDNGSYESENKILNGVTIGKRSQAVGTKGILGNVFESVGPA